MDIFVAVSLILILATNLAFTLYIWGEYQTYKLRYEEREKSIEEAYKEYNEIRELMEKVFGKEVGQPLEMVIRNVERATAPEGNKATKRTVILEYYVEDDIDGE